MPRATLVEYRTAKGIRSLFYIKQWPTAILLLGAFVGNLVVGAAKALAFGGESSDEPGAIQPAHTTDNNVRPGTVPRFPGPATGIRSARLSH
jgi:hypothetical protein